MLVYLQSENTVNRKAITYTRMSV